MDFTVKILIILYNFLYRDQVGDGDANYVDRWLDTQGPAKARRQSNYFDRLRFSRPHRFGGLPRTDSEPPPYGHLAEQYSDY